MKFKLNSIKLGGLLYTNKKEKDKWNKVFNNYFVYQGGYKKKEKTSSM
ncbi:hypothetical protein JOC77_001519 [Peribacillus deserti]|uniref:Uncharacterized protein n=1 Tax=Peribacillus deserti TaxID=673318 RepID=A0ABS2QG16_9BACI|nr:hypothetical protein [Peribacillus deserti]MBM7692092.1 hypothetical protein [Peribacillus deserti]